eukprot:EG_transcript_28634
MQTPKAPDEEAVDHEVLVVVEAQAKLQQIVEDEKLWQEKVVELFANSNVPPILDLAQTSSKPIEVQENFRVKMLEYWASNPNALKYSMPVEAANLGALEVLCYYRGHRESRGCTVIGEGSILDDLQEIHQERKERKAKAQAAILKAQKVKQTSLLKFLQPSEDDISCTLPDEPVVVSRQEVELPPSPPIPQDGDVAWWLAECGGSEGQVVSQTGFHPKICEAIWLKYG